ncbi:hypothetical protein DSO57_1019239 [Entomophthora muscae]|uniref:Uncharacterized protein n=1 Tax=Entomophthora muscae TaxID=34485 RepID=A0ACC2UDE5_9FUNG|nr:hypothetical protein DSO57_1019239 [Entomophthora muscae]
MVLYSGKFTAACLYYDGLNRLNGYIDIGGAAFGNFGRRLVEASTSTLIIGACGLYLILASESFAMMDTWTGWTHREWIIICMVVSCTPFVTIKTLKEASLLSLFGVVTTIIMVVVIVSIAFSDFLEIRRSAGSLPIPTAGLPSYHWVRFDSLPLALASISFSFGGNIVFPHVESSMQNPKSFTKVLKYSLIFVVMLYAAVATAGYLAYGDKTESPIFNNLPSTKIVTIAIVMLSLHVLLTIPINLTSFALDIEHSLGFNSNQLSLSQQSLYRVCFRVFISLLTLSVAIFVPYFDHVMALLGALSNGTLVFILPPIFYIKLFGWRSSSLSDKVASIVMVTTGMFVLVVGSSQAITALYHDIYALPV